jgi:predicted exporter
LPGLAQLGTLVAVGVTLAAFIMIFEFLPPLFPGRREAGQPAGESSEHTSSTPLLKHQSSGWIFGITGVVLAGTFVVLVFGLPPIDNTANALRPRHSPAYAALEQIQQHVNQEREPLWLIVGGSTQNEVAERLAQIQPVLERAVTNRVIDGFTLPTALWPHPAWQAANRAVAEALVSEGSALREAARAGGFAESSLALTKGILTTWERAAQDAIPFLPTNNLSRWLLEKFAAGEPNQYFALGLITPLNNKLAQDASLHALEMELPAGWTWLSGWGLLGESIFSRVKANMWKVLVPMVCLVLLSLWLAFRRPLEILLSLTVLLLSTLCLLAVMRLAGWSWNLLDLMGIPLILGTGVDYSIFMQLALRRYRGDLSMAYRSVGRALLLCGGTAVAGFGSLGLSTNAGMGSLGQVCAVGIASNMLIAIFLLPVWWHFARHHAPGKSPSTDTPLTT